MPFNIPSVLIRLVAPAITISAAAGMVVTFSVAGIRSAGAAEIRKVFDGTAAYCPPKEAHNPIVPETALRAEVDGQALLVTLNVCENGQWMRDPSPAVHRYTAPGGEIVELQFENFRLVVQTSDWTKTKFIPLPNFSTQASARLALSEIEFIEAPALDISLTAVRKTKTSTGYTFTEDVTWGALRLLK
jgi:hypothetical protein